MAGQPHCGSRSKTGSAGGRVASTSSNGQAAATPSCGMVDLGQCKRESASLDLVLIRRAAHARRVRVCARRGSSARRAAARRGSRGFARSAEAVSR
eukprot:3647197-Pleurochrysis_carterae.AAC.1